ncbi:MAG: hypothetical protein CL573_02895 [Alphaproteobacteria bacterium]|nr:hypothetical protein [Alphaproteobacteria bacterium]
MTSQEMDEVRPARRRRAWYKRRDILFILTSAVVWSGWEGYGRITGPERISDTVVTALAADPKSVNLYVTSKFPPERFHSNVYNEYGVQRGTEGATTKLYRVRPAGVRWLSRQYWIKSIDLIPPDNK